MRQIKTALSRGERELARHIDGGIRQFVITLRRAGVETFESCEGGRGHAFPDPTIRFHGDSGEGFRAVGIALTHGLPVLHLRRTYTVSDSVLAGPYWELTFRSKA
ncbi:hypothetical protein [Candidatus Binatus sp.]|uniref:hypothetical protein n=1 Tax=Candidatus Binatus sp. TaxID=2811406 RepID=UPI00272DC54A|nr:hypothetical protein [Candidatus Binatus sp.]